MVNEKKQVVISGGKKAGMPKAAHFNVLEIVEETIDGKPLMENH